MPRIQRERAKAFQNGFVLYFSNDPGNATHAYKLFINPPHTLETQHMSEQQTVAAM